MKKAEVQQVFTYILVILVVGAILILGLRSILNIMNKACDVDESSFKQEIERLLSANSRMGNLAYETIKVPCNYDELCFMTTDLDTTECSSIGNEMMKLECELGTGNNVFITKGDTTTPLFSINNLVADNEGHEFFCVEPKSGRYYVKLEGIGRGQVQISPDNV